MNTTGIVRYIDNLGRVVIPKEIRRTMQMDEGDPVEFLVERERVIIQRHYPGCSLCNKTNDTFIELYPDKLICSECAENIISEKNKKQAKEVEGA